MSRPPFLEALRSRVLVCDGAMGTMLYARGVFINRCFESLNISQPDLVTGVHREYLAAGLPVVSSAIPEVEQLGLCRIAQSPEDFVRRIHELLAEDGGGPSLERAKRILHEGWDARVDEIRLHVGEAALRRRAREHGEHDPMLLPVVGDSQPTS